MRGVGAFLMIELGKRLRRENRNPSDQRSSNVKRAMEEAVGRALRLISGAPDQSGTVAGALQMSQNSQKMSQ